MSQCDGCILETNHGARLFLCPEGAGLELR